MYVGACGTRGWASSRQAMLLCVCDSTTLASQRHERGQSPKAFIGTGSPTTTHSTHHSLRILLNVLRCMHASECMPLSFTLKRASTTSMQLNAGFTGCSQARPGQQTAYMACFWVKVIHGLEFLDMQPCPECHTHTRTHTQTHAPRPEST